MIAVDVMGGDFAPKVSLQGSLAAARNHIPVLLCGPRSRLESELEVLDSAWRSYPITFLDAHEIIEMADEPVKAVSQKQNSSLVQAVKQVKMGLAQACVSAGNSGAFMAAATLVLGRQDAIERPAIAGFLPAFNDSVLCLDLGANTECKPHYLAAFALLGVQHLEDVKKIQNPRVGLLSNGSENTKGSALSKAAFSLLEQSSLNFIGNVEPHDVFFNKVDLVVTDGFSGNILLKTAEAMGEMIIARAEGSIAEMQKNNQISVVDAHNARGVIGKIKSKIDWQNQGGALLLGVRGTVVVAHGASDAHAIEHAIALAWKSSQSQK